MTTQDRQYYVYILCDPLKPGHFTYGKLKLEYAPFYVGKGCGKRCYTHERQVERLLARGKEIPATAKARVIAKILRAKMRVVVVRLEKTFRNAADAFSEEMTLIRKIGRRDLGTGPLTNLTEGGEGAIEPMVSKKALLKRSKTVETPEYKEKWAATIKVYWDSLSEEEREARAESLRKAFAARSEQEDRRRNRRISKAVLKAYKDTDLRTRKKEAWERKPEAEKLEIAERVSKTWKEKSSDDILNISLQRLATRKGWTKKERDFYQANKDRLTLKDCDRLRLSYKKAAPEEYATFKKKQAAEVRARRYAAWTEEDRKEFGRKISKAHKERLAAQQETLWFESYGNKFKQERGRGRLVKQDIFCKKHKVTYQGIPALTVGCPECLLDMVKKGTVPNVPYTEDMARLHFKLRARYSHVLEEYRGSKTKPSLFSCLLTGETFESTLQRETEGGRTGCYNCQQRKKK